MDQMGSKGDIWNSNNYNFTYGDNDLAFANDNDDDILTKPLKFHGHALLWHKYNPNWVNNHNWTKAQMEQYIETVVDHYKGEVYVWDVVNEAFLPNGEYRNNQSITNNSQWDGSVWYQSMGEAYIKWAFEANSARSVEVFKF